MSFPTRANAKDSGIDGLGRIPGNWVISRLGFESWVRARLGWKGLKADEYVENGFAFLSTPNIKDREIDFENVNFINQERYDESPEIKIRIGDVLLAKDGSTLGTVNVVRTLPRPTTVNSSIAVITPNKSLDSVFLYYLFRSSYMEQTIQEIKGGMGVPHLFQSDLGKFYIPRPTLDEQHAIASFLDVETSKIDALVAEQRRLIELLKEKRQAVISHAVTKGLDPNVKMKPSGIDWLGDVPDHWEIAPLRRIVSRDRRITYGIVQPGERDENGRFMVRGQDYSFGWAEPQTVFRVSCKIEEPYKRSRLRSGDLVMTIVGAGIGNVQVVPEWLNDANITQTTARIAIDPEKADSRFVLAVLDGPVGKRSVGYYAKGAAQPGLNLEHVKLFPITRPPLKEQSRIADFLQSTLTQFDSLEAGAIHAINLLQERRTALISAAVTGKIDVRKIGNTETLT